MSSSDAPSAAVRTMMPPSLTCELLEDVLQARALVVVEPARDAEALALRDEDDEAAGQRDLRREARALRLHRVLHRLDEDRLALADQVLDLAAVAALELRADDLVDVEEAVLLEADLDERGLHAGQHVVDVAEIDVAGDRAALRAARDRPRRPCRPRARRRAARRRRRRRAARASRPAAVRGAAAGGGGRAPSERRRSCRCEIVLRSAGLRSPASSPPSHVGPAAPTAAALRAFCGGLVSLVRSSACCGGTVGAGLLAPAPTATTAAALGAIRIGCGVRGRAVGGGRRDYDVDRVESLRLERQQAVKPLRRRIRSSVDGTRASENSFVGARVGDAGSS